MHVVEGQLRFVSWRSTDSFRLTTIHVRSSSGVQAPGGGLKSAVSGTRYSRRKQQLASGCTGLGTVVSLLCFTYVRGPDHKAGLHFSIRAQVGIYLGDLGWVQSGARVGRFGSASSRCPVPVFPSLKIYRVSGRDRLGTSVQRGRILEVVAV